MRSPRSAGLALAFFLSAIVLCGLILARAGRGTEEQGSATTVEQVRASVRGSKAAGDRAVWLFYDAARIDTASVTAAIVRAGGRVRYASSWLHAVSAEIDPARARRLPGITHIQRVGRVYAAGAARPGNQRSYTFPLGGATAARSFRPDDYFMQQQDSATYGPNYAALRDLGVPQAHVLGFTGRSTRVAIIDTGFDTDHEAFAGARIFARRDFINRDDDVRTQPGDVPSAHDQEVHGTWVWSVLGGNKPGQLVGPAYNAEFILAKVDVEQTADDFAQDEDRWVEAVQWAASLGARVISSSLGFRSFTDKPDYELDQLDGNTAISTVVADSLARLGILLVNAVGNTAAPASASSLLAPADADSIISVGAIDAVGQLWAGSARGPTGDNRVKPELVARGVDVFAAAARAPNAYDSDVTGTSLATPFIAGIAVLFLDAWPNLNAMGVRDALIRSANNYPFSDNARGYGIPNVASAIAFPQGLETSGVRNVDINTNALTTISPIFQWHAPSVHPVVQPRYRLDLATDPQFNTILYSDTTTNAGALGLKRPLQPRGAIWWRVVAEVSLPGSTIRRATAVPPPISMPNWVALNVLNEAGPQFVNTTRPHFSWQSLTAEPPLGPLVFDLQIINNQTDAIVQNLTSLTSSDVTLRDPLTPNLAYRWQVIARSRVGVSDTVESRGTFVVTSSTQPPSTALYPSFPNPFPRAGQSSTHFWFDLAAASQVELTIHDLRGRLIRQLMPAPGCSRTLPSGQYGRGLQAEACLVTEWDGRNQSGELVPRGVYIARLRANSTVSTQRILFLPNQ